MGGKLISAARLRGMLKAICSPRLVARSDVPWVDVVNARQKTIAGKTRIITTSAENAKFIFPAYVPRNSQMSVLHP